VRKKHILKVTQQEAARISHRILEPTHQGAARGQWAKSDIYDCLVGNETIMPLLSIIEHFSRVVCYLYVVTLPPIGNGVL